MRALRLTIDLLVIAGALGALGLALHAYRAHLERVSAVASTRAAVSRLACEIGIRESLGTAELNAHGHPERIEPGWFGDGGGPSAGPPSDQPAIPMEEMDSPPTNWLAHGSAPWIEYALPGELSRDHPRVPTFRGGRGAMFWYNPMRGIIRARVPESASDEVARALYAEVNGVDWE